MKQDRQIKIMEEQTAIFKSLIQHQEEQIKLLNGVARQQADNAKLLRFLVQHQEEQIKLLNGVVRQKSDNAKLLQSLVQQQGKQTSALQTISEVVGKMWHKLCFHFRST